MLKQSSFKLKKKKRNRIKSEINEKVPMVGKKIAGHNLYVWKNIRQDMHRACLVLPLPETTACVFYRRHIYLKCDVWWSQTNHFSMNLLKPLLTFWKVLCWVEKLLQLLILNLLPENFLRSFHILILYDIVLIHLHDS